MRPWANTKGASIRRADCAAANWAATFNQTAAYMVRSNEESSTSKRRRYQNKLTTKIAPGSNCCGLGKNALGWGETWGGKWRSAAAKPYVTATPATSAPAISSFG